MGDLNSLISLGGYQDLTLKGNENDLSLDKSQTDLKITGDSNSVTSTETKDKVEIKGDNNVIGTGDNASVFQASANAFFCPSDARMQKKKNRTKKNANASAIIAIGLR